LNKGQFYIITSLLLIAFIVFQFKDNNNSLPQSLGEPLELVIVSKESTLMSQMQDTLESLLLVDIGPAPQSEHGLSITSITNNNFKGLFKRHQNICFLYEGDTFGIKIRKNLFALNQLAIVINAPTVQSLIDNKVQILQLEEKVKREERYRLISAFSPSSNTSINKKIYETHNLNITVPGNFFLAYSNPETTWIRRETNKISQGIIFVNTPSHNYVNNIDSALFLIDSLLALHVSGPNVDSYMSIEKTAPIQLEISNISSLQSIRVQSLWTMENDFMGGIFALYVFKNHLIYAYVYAPDQLKSPLVNQLDAIIQTIDSD